MYQYGFRLPSPLRPIITRQHIWKSAFELDLLLLSNCFTHESALNWAEPTSPSTATLNIYVTSTSS